MSVQRPVLLFDGDCAFCTTCANWGKRHIRGLGPIEPSQLADLDALGVTAAECDAALQWVGADGTVASGHFAVAQALIDAGKGWRVIGRAIRLPGIRQVTGVVYRWVARNRHRLPGGTPACSIEGRRDRDAR